MNDRLKEQIWLVSYFYTVCTVMLYIFLSVVRNESFHAGWSSISIVATIFIPIWLPAVWVSRGGSKAMIPIMFGVGIIAPALGIIDNTIPVITGMLIASYGIFMCPNEQQRPFATLYRIMPYAFIFVIYAYITTPIEQIARDYFLPIGRASSDSYFHETIANLIRLYKYPSIGFNGVYYLNYHTLTHYIVAGLKSSASEHPGIVYSYYNALAVKIYMGWSISYFLAAASRTRGGLLSGASYGSFVLVSLLAMHLLSGVLGSESLSIALILFIAFAPNLYEMLDCVRSSDRGSFGLNTLSILFYGILVCAAKVSIGLMFLLSLSYISFAAFKTRKFIESAKLLAVCGVTSILSLWLLAARGTALGGILHFNVNSAVALSSYLQMANLNGFMLLCLPGLIFLSDRIPLFIGEPEINISKSIRDLTIVSYVGAISVLILLWVGSDIVSFFYPAYSITILALMSALLALIGDFKLAWAGVSLITLWILGASANKFIEDRRVLRAYCEADLKQTADTSCSRADGLKRLMDSQINRIHEALPTDAPAPRSGGPIIYVTEKNADFWDMMKGKSPYWCTINQFFLKSIIPYPTALSGEKSRIRQQCLPDGFNIYLTENQPRTTIYDADHIHDLCISGSIEGVITLNSLYDRQYNKYDKCP